ncbi:MAG TPA: MerR family transcriptional regulator, partial [Gammaproteobacteria bacterium]|nr:MerR family transcriptional regulator [Gammaproteobacteria bacterium]
LYEEGFTIGGARQQLSAKNPEKEDHNYKKKLIKELITELEEIKAYLVK